MKDNKLMLNNSNSDSLEGDTKREFDQKLENIYKKALEIMEYDAKAVRSRFELKDLGNDFVEKFKNNKRELGKAVSWIGDIYRRDELASILEGSITKTGSNYNSLDKELKKVSERMSIGLKRPENYSDDHFTDLVNVLNKYDYFFLIWIYRIRR